MEYTFKKISDTQKDPFEGITEMCDVCGHDIPVRESIRTIFYNKYGIRYVIRHHRECDIRKITPYL